MERKIRSQLSFTTFSFVLLVALCFATCPAVSADEGAALIKLGRSKAQGCTRCHGRNGIRIAAERANMGSSVGIFAQQELNAFKTGQRINPIMSAVAQTLTDEDIRAIMAWLDSM